MADSRPLLLEVEHLCKWFPLKRTAGDVLQRKEKRYLKAVNDVSFQLFKGENLGLVGESGCGKSTLARTILRLYEPTSGTIRLNGTDISHMKGDALRRLRPQMQMIFQDPYSSLNPRMSVYDTIAEMLRVHKVVPAEELPARVEQLLTMSGLTMDIAERFPGEFSGGQRQRIGIARALSLNPAFIVADEPVSALDVSIQAQIINLLAQLQRELELTVLFISHDLRVVRHITHRVMVMYLGSNVEVGPTEAIFQHPAHPYTQVLTKAAPKLDPLNRQRDYAIEGEPPSPIHTPTGCKFHPRCPYCTDKCRSEVPDRTALRTIQGGNTMRLSNLTWPKAEEYFRAHDTVLIGIGSIECHGRHMPLGTDTLIPDFLLDKIEQKSDVLICPTIPYGATESLCDYPGTINLGTELLYQVLGRVCDSLFQHGARRFVILNGHGGNIKSIDRVGYDIQRKGGILAELNWWLMAWDMDPAWKGGHGGGEETAAILGIAPSLVDQSEVAGPMKLHDVSDTLKATGFTSIEYKGVTVNIPRLTPSVTHNGWIGPDHPETATEEWGRKMLQTTADYIVDFMEEFKKVDIAKACGTEF